MLRSLSDGNFIIKLKEGEETILGRNLLTRIRDMHCSRKHVSVKLNNKLGICELTHTGRFKGKVCGKPVHNSESRWLFHGDTVELLTGKHIFQFQRLSPIIAEQAYLKNLEYGSWQQYDSVLIYNLQSVPGNSMIAAFDLFGSIVHGTSGNTYQRDMNAWTMSCDKVIPTLKKHVKEGYKIVIFTNQSGFSKKQLLIDDFKKKIVAINRFLCVPFQCFAATADDWYQKPRPGMWELFCRMGNAGVEVDKDKSFFVGNAAGRIEEANVPADYSSTDRLFALNCGLKFWSSAQHYYDHPDPDYQISIFRPRTVFNRNMQHLMFPVDTPLPVADEPEIILLCGFPAAGKTFYAKRHLEPLGVKIISWEDDNLTLEQCLSLVEETLRNDRAVVVDSTNPNADSRKPFIDLANNFNCPIRCFLFEATQEQALHNYIYRKIKNPECSRPNSLIDFHKVILVRPSVEEGFSSIVCFTFVPEFDDPDDETIYKYYMIGK
ncbi:Uncharacterized protein TSPI_08864 [Trichinella spiralis]|uniref:Uncharacterized protein n=2 Tax=Trichinella spiralis TaxID=6334 RepID=A0A0V1B6I8_TRISP|nr:Uncharacterized protein T01_12474 [Trichinella spiralis]